MRLNASAAGLHPAHSGYTLEFFVNDNDPTNFQSGSGSMDVTFPEIAVTGLQFRGKDSIFDTGIQLLSDLAPVIGGIELGCYFSGDLNGISGESISNIKTIEVFTGDSETFEADFIEGSNRVKRENVSTNNGFYTVFLTSGELEGLYDVNLFYKVMPLDYLTFGEVSEAVSGEMFSGFDDFRKITTDNVLIARTNGNDYNFGFSNETTEIFSGTFITLSDDIPADFNASFRIRTNNQTITISGSGTTSEELITNVAGLSVVGNALTIPTGNIYSEFYINRLLDESDAPSGFFVGAN